MDIEPKPTAQSAVPITDVTPPAKTEPGVAEPPKADEPATAPPDTAAAPAEEHTDKPAPVPPPKPAKTFTAPVTAIVLSVLCFLALSALAYYAYMKGR